MVKQLDVNRGGWWEKVPCAPSLIQSQRTRSYSKLIIISTTVIQLSELVSFHGTLTVAQYYTANLD